MFKIPIPASRSSVPTGYGYVLPDQNGWSRYLHFQSAWLVVFTGLLYIISIFVSGHLQKKSAPSPNRSFVAGLLHCNREPLALQAAG